MAREFSKAFYHSIEWRTVREFALMRDNYLCRKCGAPAEEVHHIKHLTPDNISDPNITLNPDNLTCLCRNCHFEEHLQDKAEGKRKNKAEIIPEYEFDENGMVVLKEKDSPLSN